MMRPATHIVIPVKTAQRAKGRLSEFLAPAARRDLARAMLRDVLRAALAARHVEDVWVVSHDRSALADAKDLGARPLQEKYDMGLNPALRFAARAAMEAGAGALLILPSDVPLVRAADLARVLGPLGRCKPGERRVLGVASREGTGTNALLRLPPEVIPPRFGPGSFEKHRREAGRRGVPFAARRVARLALDVDTPRDLLGLLSRERQGDTARVLERLELL
ncbi:MAG: 2-phospho-L-lactate guanylyltransferase [Myxococcota bacterium]